MANLAGVGKESTSLNSTTSAHSTQMHYYFDVDRVAQYLDVGWSSPSYIPYLRGAPRPPVGVNVFANTIIGKLLEEQSHAALSGTGVLDSNLWSPLYPVVRDLIATGIGDGTQHLLTVRRKDLPWPSKAHEAPDAGELVRRALNLSGLTREQLAFAIGVRRQSVHNWLGARGGMSPDNRQRLEEVVALFERARRRLGSARQVANWLTKPVQEVGPSPLEMLATSKIDTVRGRLLRRTPIRGSVAAPAQGTGRVPRRIAAAGYSPPWSQPSRMQEFDPEESSDSPSLEEPTEPYRNVPSPRVTGLARA